MSALKQLNRFLHEATKDERLLPSHISLYVAMVSLWRKSNFDKAFRIARRDLMQLSHISSIATYHKCIRQLDEYGYIKYQSSYNYYKGCQVQLCLTNSTA